MPRNPQRKFELEDRAVGAVLRAVRETAGLSLQGAGPRAGMNWRTLGKIERGERPARVTELVELARAYQVDEFVLIEAVGGDEAAQSKLGIDTEDGGTPGA